MPDRPDRPLVVKCTFDNTSSKKINFTSARNCSHQLLKTKVEQCFALSATPFAISWKDDDGEVSDITSEAGLTEAIQYFGTGGDDPPQSSAASIRSGRSFGSKRITMKVIISVDYDGRLSDTSSLASNEEYEGRNFSQASLSIGSFPSDLDDDSKTVSSGNGGTGASITFSHSVSQVEETSMPHATDENYHYSAHLRFPEDPSDLLERMRMETSNQESPPTHPRTLGRDSERGAAWLRDQNNRTVMSRFGSLPAPSEGDGISLAVSDAPGSEFDGGLALKRAPSGKYYYSYTSASSSTTSQLSSEDPRLPGDFHVDQAQSGSRDPELRPSLPRFSHSRSDPLPSRVPPKSDFGLSDEFIPKPEEIPAPPQDILTDCSECGKLLDKIRYVCSTCGEKPPLLQPNRASGKGKATSNAADDLGSYPPTEHRSDQQPSSSSFLSSVPVLHKPLPSLPYLSRSFSSDSSWTMISSTSSASPRAAGGFELCEDCIGSAGINHALETTLHSYTHGVPGMPGSSEDAQSARRRAAPVQKGQLRHGYIEKLWGSNGWEDVDQGDCAECSTCSSSIIRGGYKCVVCSCFVLCRACYSQAHGIHPAHPFLVMSEKQMRSSSEPDLTTASPVEHEESALKHPGVKCAHCMLDIIGARYHCAICESVDICSNCESAGLPGNLDSSDGGHNSSHVMIKIPYPLEFHEVQRVSRRAHLLWTARDEQTVHRAGPSSKPSSVYSYARTVVGPGSRMPHLDPSSLLGIPNNHGVCCNGCNMLVIGIRYQCANCPSLPASYSLCEACEERSYLIHDPTHAFFKLPRPVKRPIESAFPLIPKLYKVPAGPPPGSGDTSAPNAYLRHVMHSAALCDVCMSRIQGAWFRCVYCGKDLCGHCEKLDAHDDSHIFLVLKSTVDMDVFRVYMPTENPDQGPPLIPYTVY